MGGEPLPASSGNIPGGRFEPHATATVQEIIADTSAVGDRLSASAVRGQRAASFGQPPASFSPQPTALCLPISAGGAAVGLLYLESGQERDTFAQDLVARLLKETPVDLTGRAEMHGSSGESAKSSSALAPSVIVPLAELEREAILRALQIHRGNRTAAARALGISVRKLQYRIKEYARQGLSITSP